MSLEDLTIGQDINEYKWDICTVKMKSREEVTQRNGMQLVEYNGCVT